MDFPKFGNHKPKGYFLYLVMKKIFPLLFFGLCAFEIHAQTLNSPESVEYNPTTQTWFISNNGSGEILESAANGTLSVFASGIGSGPHGMEIIGDSLYVCDGSNLRLYLVSTGALLSNTNLGATFLNGITHDPFGNLFITDFSGKKIYRFTMATGQFNVFVSGLTKSPNGIIYDNVNQRLVFVNWGSNAPIMAVNLADSTTSTLYATTLGNCDGIGMNCQGEFFVSSWSPNRISKFPNDFSSAPVNMNASGLSSPADIYFAQSTDSLGVPNSGNNSVTYYHYASCLNVGVDNMQAGSELTRIFQSGDQLHIELSVYDPTNVLEIFDLNGRLLQRFSAGQAIVWKPENSGVYIISLQTSNGISVEKTVFTK